MLAASFAVAAQQPEKDTAAVPEVRVMFINGGMQIVDHWVNGIFIGGGLKVIGIPRTPLGILAGIDFVTLYLGNGENANTYGALNMLGSYTSVKHKSLWFHIAAGYSMFFAKDNASPGIRRSNKEITFLPKVEIGIGGNPVMVKASINLLDPGAVAREMYAVGIMCYPFLHKSKSTPRE